MREFLIFPDLLHEKVAACFMHRLITESENIMFVSKDRKKDGSIRV